MARLTSDRLTSFVATIVAVSLSACNGQGHFPQDGTLPQDPPKIDPNCVTNDLSQCYVGAAFADCGPGEPWAYCSTLESESCLWISNSCPADNYRALLLADCSCGPAVCPFPRVAFVEAYGKSPWNRVREMNLFVRLDSTLSTPAKVEVNCTGCGTTCETSGPTICKKSITADPQFVVELFASPELPGTFIQRIDVRRAFASTYLEIEVDLKANPIVARACQLYRTDAPKCRTRDGLPSCAISGEVILSGLPTQANLKTITGHFTTKFTDGLVIEGRF